MYYAEWKLESFESSNRFFFLLQDTHINLYSTL